MAVAPEIIALGGDLRPVRTHLQAFDLPRARALKLIARGRLLDLLGGQELRLKVKDIVLALRILALSQLLRLTMPAPALLPFDPVTKVGLAAVVEAAMGGSLRGEAPLVLR